MLLDELLARLTSFRSRGGRKLSTLPSRARDGLGSAPVVPVPKNGSSTTSPGFASITAERGTRGSDRPPGNHRADAAAILGRFDGGRAGLLESM